MKLTVHVNNTDNNLLEKKDANWVRAVTDELIYLLQYILWGCMQNKRFS